VSSGEFERIGEASVLDDRGRKTVETIVERIKGALSAGTWSYELIERAVIDIRTIEVQLLSSAPRTAVIKELLRGLSQLFAADDADGLGGKIQAIIAG
jgi:hypothetical protein